MNTVAMLDELTTAVEAAGPGGALVIERSAGGAVRIVGVPPVADEPGDLWSDLLGLVEAGKLRAGIAGDGRLRFEPVVHARAGSERPALRPGAGAVVGSFRRV